MFDQNKSGRTRKSKTLHGNFARIDPNAEITSAFINQAISQSEGTVDGAPFTGQADVIRARNWVDENHK